MLRLLQHGWGIVLGTMVLCAGVVGAVHGTERSVRRHGVPSDGSSLIADKQQVPTGIILLEYFLPVTEHEHHIEGDLQGYVTLADGTPRGVQKRGLSKGRGRSGHGYGMGMVDFYAVGGRCARRHWQRREQERGGGAENPSLSSLVLDPAVRHLTHARSS